MAINPASVQSVMTRYPNPRPGFGDNLAALANAFLRGNIAQQQNQDESTQKAFLAMAPALAARGQIQPGGRTRIGRVQYPFTLSQGSQDWGDINSMLLAKERMDQLSHPNRLSPGQAWSNFWNTRAGTEAFSKGLSADEVAKKVLAYKQAWDNLVDQPQTPITANKTFTPADMTRAKAYLKKNGYQATDETAQAFLNKNPNF